MLRIPSNFNLGNGEGYSVKEVVELAREITDQPIPKVISKRRPGDPAVLVGSSKKAKEILGGKPEYSELSAIMKTAWKWYEKFPDVYC
jgi:UDP-glucose 4-epimerase